MLFYIKGKKISFCCFQKKSKVGRRIIAQDGLFQQKKNNRSAQRRLAHSQYTAMILKYDAMGKFCCHKSHRMCNNSRCHSLTHYMLQGNTPWTGIGTFSNPLMVASGS